MKSYCVALVAVVLMLLATLRPQAQAERGIITGRVTNAAGAPQAGVTVTLVHVLTEVSTQTKTDATGTFRSPDLRPGPYQVSAIQGTQGAFVDVTLGAGETRTVTLAMKAGVKPPPLPAPDEPPAPPPPPAQPTSAAPKTPDFVPMPDRWRLEFPAWQRYPREIDGEFPYVRGRAVDPYNTNTLKGDRPVAGQDVFFVLTAVSETVAEFRRLPTPSGASAEEAGAQEFFGNGEQYAVLPTGVVSLELFKGDTAFKPRTWAVRVTPVFNMNYVQLQERNALNVSPEFETTRRRQDVALQEAFGEIKLFDVGPNYDFVSVRAGIQPFNSDFRGFLFRDTNLGLRVFGTIGRNRNQWNVAYFDQLEKETNSDLNLAERRHQKVYVANFFRQDFLTPGYTISPSFHANFDEGEELFFDTNGFLVRPSPVGVIQPHAVRAYYAGIGGDGHIGGLNITHQFYQAFGRDEFNGVSGHETDIQAQFGAVELSVDRNWYRPKVAVIFASGDDDPDDDRAKGFDAILDNPNVAGGVSSFWNRQGIRLAQTSLALVGRNSVLPSLRSSKAEGQASFVNPGVLLVGGGVDAEWTRKLRMTANVNYARFHQTEVLERLLFQPAIDKAIGIDAGVGFQYRPFLNDNMVIQAGASVLVPGKGFKQILTDDVLYAPFVAVTVAY